MELKGKQVEDFVKAIDESEKMNKKLKGPFQAYESTDIKEINCIYIYIYKDATKPMIGVVDDAELEKFKETIQKQRIKG